jgi:four helix bundle protein
MHAYRSLDVWKRSRAAALEAYRLTRTYPEDERFGLSAQLRRAAVSVEVNIVEGSKRTSCREFTRFLNIAEGSAAEARSLLELSGELGYGPDGTASRLAREFAELELMLAALRRRIATAPPDAT